MASQSDLPPPRAQRTAQGVELRVAGQKIVVRADGDPTLIEEVVKLASQRLEAAENRANSKAGATGFAPPTHTAPHVIALLALLDLAEEYALAKRRVEAHRDEVLRAAQALFSAPDSNQITE